MITFILAMGRDRSIGSDNKLPWRLPADLAYFKRTTMGHPILMGRKTYQSIGKPLPGRTNLVATRDELFQAEGIEVVRSPREAAEAYRDQELFVIGGAEIFRLFYPYADRIHLTVIDADFPADTYFTVWDESEWKLVSMTPGVTDEKNPYRYEFRVYERSHRRG
ncbi:dihydrofolate reductase [Gorillibacterium timonense]|uniref:dihydrofolate reductase n=1 Tax=Gorillibacterium timonense TaxID=1689269 RepID=UPI00071C37CE|nr:dihydrofolate reductase [Gorillibacterium timonense]